MRSESLDELKGLPQWILWRSVVKEGRKKPVKLPLNPKTGRAASHSDSTTWGTFAEARAGYKKFRPSGLGFVFTHDDGLIGVDLDDCVHAGVIEGWAQHILEGIGAYAEFSPSDSGIHVITRGEIPRSIKKDLDGVEIYKSHRYFTITGKRVPGTPDTLDGSQDALTELCERFMKMRNVVKGDHIPTRGVSNTAPPEEVVASMLDKIRGALDYHTWLSICQSVYSAYPNSTGIMLIEGWKPGVRGEVEGMWKSFDRNSRGEVTIGTLVHHAKQNGWKPQAGSMLPPASKVEFDKVVKKLQTEAYWQGFHDGMTAAQRAMWPYTDAIVDLYNLGVQRKVDEDTGEITETRTVPFVSLQGIPTNVEYIHESGAVTYEQDVTASLFHTSTDEGRLVVVDKSTAAIDLYLSCGAAQSPDGSSIHVASLSQLPITLESFGEHQSPIVISDRPVEELGSLSAIEGRVVRTPLSIEKMLEYGLTAEGLGNLLTQAREI